MAIIPAPQQQGDLKQLADSGLRVKDAPNADGPVIGRPTGRPAGEGNGPSGTKLPPPPPLPDGPPPITDVPPAHHQMIVDLAQHQQAVQHAGSLAATSPGDEWVQWYQQLATDQRDQAAQIVATKTPNFDLSGLK
jgi:hypothetical protein